MGLLDAISDSLTQEDNPRGCGCIPRWQGQYFWFAVLERVNAMLWVCEEPCAKGARKSGYDHHAWQAAMYILYFLPLLLDTVC